MAIGNWQKQREWCDFLNDFDFQSDEVLSSTHNNTVFGAISKSNVRFDKNDAAFLIRQKSVDYAALEADRHKPAM